MFRNYDAQGGDGSSAVAIYEAGGVIVRVTAQPGDKPAEAAAAITAFNVIFTGKPIMLYAIAFLANRKIIWNAFITYDTACRQCSDPPTTAEKRTLLGSTLTILSTLPQAFKDRVDKWQSRKGLPRAPGVPVNTWTQVQCDGWMDLLDAWFGQALGGVAGSIAGDLD